MVDKDNPWNGKDVMDFNFFCCPECDYQSKTVTLFQNHALDSHPLSKEVFEKSVQVKEEYFEYNDDIILPSDQETKEEVKDECDQKTLPKKVEKKKLSKAKMIIRCNCGETFNTKTRYKLHQRQVHGIVEPQPLSSKKTQKVFICDKCGKRFYQRTKFESHVSSEDCLQPAVSEKDPKCKICGETFSGKSYYIQHYNQCHGTLPPEYNDSIQYLCDQCPKVFTTKQGLRIHIQVTHNGKSQRKTINRERQCPHCDKSFIKHTNYREHIKAKHENSTPFKCDQCHRSYGTQVRLKSHVRQVHTRVRCEECNQEICNTFILKRHRATVHGIKPDNTFQCDHCPLFYDSKTGLDRHMIKHNK